MHRTNMFVEISHHNAIHAEKADDMSTEFRCVHSLIHTYDFALNNKSNKHKHNNMFGQSRISLLNR